MSSRCVLVLSIGALSGCSIAFMRQPPAPQEIGMPVRCSDSALLPTADAALAVAASSLAVVVLSRQTDEHCWLNDQGGVGCGSALPRVLLGLGLAGAGVGHLSSSAIGFAWRHRCRDARASSPVRAIPLRPVARGDQAGSTGNE